MKVGFVLSHPGSRLFGEVREAMIAQDLTLQGHDAQIYRVQARPQERQERFGDSVSVRFFPADDPTANAHQTVSEALLNAIVDDSPDILLFKGLGYDIVARVLGKVAPGQARIGFILGGVAIDPALARADFVLAESEGQIDQIRSTVSRRLPCTTLAKFIDWATADRLYAERQAAIDSEFDIVNVGSFEPRKNQIALAAFFGRFRVAFVGAGETQTAVAQAASDYSGVKLFGAMSNTETLGVVGRSRLMVHASLWEGVPRAVFEALACGTPVLAHNFAIQERFDNTRAVCLVGKEELAAKADALLANPPLLAAMGEEGRAYARERHGPQRLAEAAKYILSVASQ